MTWTWHIKLLSLARTIIAPYCELLFKKTWKVSQWRFKNEWESSRHIEHVIFFSQSVKLWCLEGSGKKVWLWSNIRRKKPFIQFSTGVRQLIYLYESRYRVLEDSMTVQMWWNANKKVKSKESDSWYSTTFKSTLDTSFYSWIKWVMYLLQHFQLEELKDVN